MMMTGAPIKLTQADAADVADLYNRCSDYFLLQDGAAPTLDDEAFSDYVALNSRFHVLLAENGRQPHGGAPARTPSAACRLRRPRFRSPTAHREAETAKAHRG